MVCKNKTGRLIYFKLHDLKRNLLSRMITLFPRLYCTLKIFVPLIWPRKNLLLQLNLFVGFVTIVLGCAVNVYAPIYSKKIVDSLSFIEDKTLDTPKIFNEDGQQLSKSCRQQFHWEYIFIYAGLRIVQGVGALSLLNCIHSLLWIKIEQHARKQVQMKFFEHVHTLSARWHSNKKTADVLGALERGTDSINSILEHIIFSIFPTIADIVIAVTYLSLNFGIWFGLAIFIQTIIYLVATVWITEWRAKYQRTMNNADNKQRHQAIESLTNFETVKHFANEAYEKEKFVHIISQVQRTQWKATISIIFMQITQLLIMNSGLLFGSLVVVWMIFNKWGNDFSAGDYVLFTSYLGQLYGPLNYLGTYYRDLRTSLIDLECMIEIFEVKQEVSDTRWSYDLKVENGRIEFKNVTFGYEKDELILKNISFVIPPQKVVALVGQSGSGKTSILRLLLRFYDVTSGEILIDEQNVRDVTQESLRRAIGIVPQDTILFNESLKHNIKYSKLDADDHEVVAACTASCIHEKISQFPEGYDTMVGERGLKLSGGEKQRVAIARTLLKNPPITVFDEATSALDVHTEREIQTTFRKLCEKRSSLIITHKLSTITHADEILVLKNGQIVERGKHSDLLIAKGEYASMWAEQTKVPPTKPKTFRTS